MADELLKRVMPNNVEAEQSVIGAMLMDRDAIAIASEIDVYKRQGFLRGAAGFSSAFPADGQNLRIPDLQPPLSESDRAVVFSFLLLGFRP